MSAYPVRIEVSVELPEPVEFPTGEKTTERILSVTWEATGWHAEGLARIRIRGLARGSWSVHTTFGVEDRPSWAPAPPPQLQDMVIDMLTYSRMGR